MATSSNPGANYGWVEGARDMLYAIAELVNDTDMPYVKIQSPWSTDTHTVTRSILEPCVFHYDDVADPDDDDVVIPVQP